MHGQGEKGSRMGKGETKATETTETRRPNWSVNTLFEAISNPAG